MIFCLCHLFGLLQVLFCFIIGKYRLHMSEGQKLYCFKFFDILSHFSDLVDFESFESFLLCVPKEELAVQAVVLSYSNIY